MLLVRTLEPEIEQDDEASKDERRRENGEAKRDPLGSPATFDAGLQKGGDARCDKRKADNKEH